MLAVFCQVIYFIIQQYFYKLSFEIPIIFEFMNIAILLIDIKSFIQQHLVMQKYHLRSVRCLITSTRLSLPVPTSSCWSCVCRCRSVCMCVCLCVVQIVRPLRVDASTSVTVQLRSPASSLRLCLSVSASSLSPTPMQIGSRRNRKSQPHGTLAHTISTQMRRAHSRSADRPTGMHSDMCKCK